MERSPGLSPKQAQSPAVFVSLIQNPVEARVLAAIGIVHLIMAGIGVQGWECPVFQATGIPCPGCGLSRAAAALLRGDWQTMAATHFFAPVFVGAILITMMSAIFPVSWREVLIEKIKQIEHKTRITQLVIIALTLYWGLRLGLDSSGFIALIKTTP